MRLSFPQSLHKQLNTKFFNFDFFNLIVILFDKFILLKWKQSGSFFFNVASSHNYSVTDQFSGGRLSRTSSMSNIANRIGQRRRGGASNVRGGQLQRTNSQRNLRPMGSKQNINNFPAKRLQNNGARGGLQGQRRGSVNSRLGRAAAPNQVTSPRGPGRTRIFRRRDGAVATRGGGANAGRTGLQGRIGQPQQQQPRGRSRNRMPRNANGGNPQQQRGRSQSRNRRQNQNQNQNQNQKGRSRSRSNRRNRSRSRGQIGRQPAKSKEQLDKELDQYMSNSNSN